MDNSKYIDYLIAISIVTGFTFSNYLISIVLFIANISAIVNLIRSYIIYHIDNNMATISNLIQSIYYIIIINSILLFNMFSIYIVTNFLIIFILCKLSSNIYTTPILPVKVQELCVLKGPDIDTDTSIRLPSVVLYLSNIILNLYCINNVIIDTVLFKIIGSYIIYYFNMVNDLIFVL